jgi:hypothetical protein
LVAFQEPAGDKPATTETAPQAAAETPGEQKPAADQPATEKPAESKPAEPQPATPESTKPVDPKPADGEPKAADKPADSAPEQPAAPKVEPFEKVRDDIAESLAMQPALNKLDAAVTEVDKAMRAYFNGRAIAGTKVDKIPPRPDLKALAEKLGMKHVVTGLINGQQIQDEPISLSFGVGSGMQRGDGFVQVFFASRPPKPLFTSVRTVDDQGRISYISWKTEDKPDYIPELKEIREEVITAIRTVEARKLAKLEADRLSKEFSSSDKPAKDLIPAERASMLFSNLGPFSWMNSLGFQMRAFIGNVPELDSVGEEFMRQVFTSERDKWGVAPNVPETVYYVVRPTEFTPSTDELHQRFTQLTQRMQALSLARDETAKIQSGHYEALDKRTGFKWNEDALSDEE